MATGRKTGPSKVGEPRPQAFYPAFLLAHTQQRLQAVANSDKSLCGAPLIAGGVDLLCAAQLNDPLQKLSGALRTSAGGLAWEQELTLCVGAGFRSHPLLDRPIPGHFAALFGPTQGFFKNVFKKRVDRLR